MFEVLKIIMHLQNSNHFYVHASAVVTTELVHLDPIDFSTKAFST